MKIDMKLDLDSEDIWPFDEENYRLEDWIRQVIEERLKYHIRKEVDKHFANEAHLFGHVIARRIREMELEEA